MISAKLVLDEGEGLLSFRATGHAAAGDRGYDIVCAAFSVLCSDQDVFPGTRTTQDKIRFTAIVFILFSRC